MYGMIVRRQAMPTIERERKYYLEKVLHTEHAGALDIDRMRFNHVFALFGFTGSGKDTVIDGVLEQEKTIPLTRFVRTLTRDQRPTEQDGVDDFFVERELFEYLKARERFFYYYGKYGDEYGYDTDHFLFELAQKNIIMVGGHENNMSSLRDGMKSLFPQIPLVCVFVNRPKEAILDSLGERGGSLAETLTRREFIEKEWYQEPQQPVDAVIWNEDRQASIEQMRSLIEHYVTRHIDGHSCGR